MSSLFLFLPTPEFKETPIQQIPIESVIPAPQYTEGIGNPVHLFIPVIQVDATIRDVGLTPEGAMDVPRNPKDVGWYDLGPRPGEEGSAVLAGHLDWYNGQKAVFKNLDKLKAGDVLFVETDTQKRIRFVVREIRTYYSTEYAPDVFQNNDGTHLHIITCSGGWDSIKKDYRKRIVVFADAMKRVQRITKLHTEK